MAVAYNAQVVRNGLVVYLDAGNVKSYPGTGSGSVWYDLSGYNNNANFFNDPAFISDGGGSLFFDISDADYAYINPSSTTQFDAVTSYTISLWFKSNSLVRVPDYENLDTLFEGNGGARIWFFLTNDNYLYFNTYYGPPIYDGNGNITGYLNDYYQGIGYIDNPDKWYNALVVHDKTNLKQRTYLDGELVEEQNLLPGYTFTSNIGGGFYIANGTFGITRSTFSNIQVYNRALSESEVRQNFNALRGRFGI